MQKLVKEIRTTISDFSSVTENTLSKMPYLNAVIKEVLRLRPSAPTLPTRETTRVFGSIVRSLL